MEKLSLKYKRLIRPSLVLPSDLIRGFYERDEVALKEVSKWLDKNGLNILFTLGYAYGDEKVFLDEDNRIYIGTDTLPNMDWLKKCLLKQSNDLLSQAIREKWTRKKMFNELKKSTDFYSTLYKN